MIAVLDTNAVIGLAKGECLEEIHSLFRQVVVPPAVRSTPPCMQRHSGSAKKTSPHRHEPTFGLTFRQGG